MQGPLVSGKTVNIGINCDMANVFDVAAAARLAEALASEPHLSIAQPAAAAEPARKAG
jgi:predicted anti-sigma-YlaC factor YlaD